MENKEIAVSLPWDKEKNIFIKKLINGNIVAEIVYSNVRGIDEYIISTAFRINGLQIPNKFGNPITNFYSQQEAMDYFDKIWVGAGYEIISEQRAEKLRMML